MSKSSTSQINLEQVLKRISPGLSERLDGVRKAANKVWEVPYLHWYTDHGPQHSQRVIGLIGQILYPLCLGYLSRRENDFPLSDYELYILLAACYLHDIGMQDLKVDERPVDELGPGDWEEIRKRHPRRSFEIIRDRTIKPRRRRTIDLGLAESDDDDSLMPIALVSMAHGSEYFESAVSTLQKNLYHPAGKPIRGDLLAALLMMGDEIDLHKSRAKLTDDSRQYSPLSLLHHYKHTHVSSVAVQDGRSPLDRQIIVGFLFPPQAQGSYGRDLEAWVVNKIEEQARRTQGILLSATEGQLRWDEKPVVAKIQYDEYGEREAFPSRVQKVLTEQLQKLEVKGETATGLAWLQPTAIPGPPSRETTVSSVEATAPPRPSAVSQAPAGTPKLDRTDSVRGCLWLWEDGECKREFVLNKPSTLIGRSSRCDLKIREEYYNVSRQHARVERKANVFVIFDGSGTESSTFGTFVNGEEVDSDSGKVLQNGDCIVLGGLEQEGSQCAGSGACVLVFDEKKDNQDFLSLSPKRNGKELTETSEQGEFQTESTAQIFLCYAREDEERVRNLYQKLSDEGFKPWVDKKDILPGERWKSSIQKAIRRSDFFLVCLSANSANKRGFLQKEINDALDIRQETLEDDIYLIPVRLEDCKVPERLCDFQWVDMFEEDGWTQLVEAIQVGMKRRK